MSDRRREFTLRHNVQHHLGQSDDWIVCVSLVMRICNELSRHFVGHRTSFQTFCRYVNCLTEPGIPAGPTDAQHRADSGVRQRSDDIHVRAGPAFPGRAL